MRKTLAGVRLLIKSDYGSTFILTTEGETAAEALANAVVTEVDRHGRHVSVCCAPECPVEIHDAVVDLITRLWGVL